MMASLTLCSLGTALESDQSANNFCEMMERKQKITFVCLLWSKHYDWYHLRFSKDPSPLIHRYYFGSFDTSHQINIFLIPGLQVVIFSNFY